MKKVRQLIAAVLACIMCAGLVFSATAAGTDTSYSVVSGGMSHTLAVKTDGTVWAWGSNESGQLGQSLEKTESREPIKVDGLTAVSVVAGYNFSAALQYDGTVYTWGGGNTKPTQVAGLNTVSAIAAGQTDLLVLKYDGTVWQWTVGSSTGFRQVYGLQKINAVAAGGGCFLALTVSGQVWAWGSNTYGQLGLGDTNNRTTPVQIVQLSDIVDIAAGFSHSLAVAFDGTVYTWGSNTYGELGNGTSKSSAVPVKLNTLTKVRQISAGTNTSMAVTEKGVIYTWGYGEYGQLGTNTASISQPNPSTISIGSQGTPVFIASGLYHNLLVNSYGDVFAWGRNKNSQLGNSQNTNSMVPQRVVSLSVANSSFSVGRYVVNTLQGLNSWSETDVKTLYKTDFISPRSWIDFDKNITRAEFAHMLVNVYGRVTGFSITGSLPTTFTDVKGHVLEKDCLEANYVGIINGRSSTIFAPDDSITREEAVKMLCTLVAKIKYVSISTSVPSLSYYSDAASIGKWAAPYVAYAHDNNIVVGSDGMFNPKGNFTREQSLLTIAKLVQRYSWHA